LSGWLQERVSVTNFAATNDAFPNERETDPNCQLNDTPESTTNLKNFLSECEPRVGLSQDIVNFTEFVRMLAPPTPVPDISHYRCTIERI
jgi:hypothetical protein